MKIRLVEAQLFHADRRTYRHNEALLNFANAPKNFPFVYKVFLFITSLINNNNHSPETVLIDWSL